MANVLGSRNCALTAACARACVGIGVATHHEACVGPNKKSVVCACGFAFVFKIFS